MTIDQERTLLMAHVADAIDRVGGNHAEWGYDETADMAAEMLDRFAHVREAAAGYVADTVDQHGLDDAVLDALAGF
jgi:hypothetical protein